MPLLKTNTNRYKNNMQQFLFDCIESEDIELTTLKDKLNHLFEEFKRVANYEYNLRRYPNPQDRLADYLQGLPFSFPFSYYEIIESAKELHETTEITEKQADRIIQNYWSHIAFHVLKTRQELNK